MVGSGVLVVSGGLLSFGFGLSGMPLHLKGQVFIPLKSRSGSGIQHIHFSATGT